ncbi:sugar efflux transporter [Ursidibacter maritimus]|uniref:Sugar efflux transporter n=1 Tax=Ursidibacter maritimus TaxID=1331689 RepID=A0A949WFB2_9PAST|nr:sugar efflux transporter [Ursidibacter maritimus]MBV6523912.1 sugar efflux transporter [Ursidibacter maritimus]MBV6525784.1 sugar efflux transporter [Ursidibacter maritimus]MBV6526866.1 sugar efflux transporter [Ursidibacter maritimus]MBV6529844.1 sugar efflux transporter [Ursidibacter maritimus]MBV6531292.1 sugar efflux transporter [Ursidibacter maritimus]
MQPLNPLQPNISRRLLTSASAAFLIVIFMTGLAGALRIPALTVYLHKEVTSDPMMVGLFYSVNSLVSMVLSQIVAHYSDRYPNRKLIIALSCVMQMFGCLLFAFNRDYYVLLILGTLILGLGSSASSQLFALSREYSKSQKRDSTMFNTVLRAQLSLAWIVGPPLAYLLSDQFGFTFMYCAAATIFAMSIIIVILMLPQAVSSEPQIANSEDEQLREEGISSNRNSVILLCFTCLFVWTCNSMVFINMPIYLSESLGLSDRLAGLLMGTAAAIEIPVMLIAGYCTKFISKKSLMLMGIVAGIGYYLCLSLATTEWQLIASQLLNGLFVGILASIGMIYFQDLMPYKMGTATTLFTNTGSASWVTAGPIAGIMASQFGYHSTWYLAIGLCVIALILMWFVRKI